MTKTILATIGADSRVKNDVLRLSALIAVDGMMAVVEGSLFQTHCLAHVKQGIQEATTLSVVEGRNDYLAQGV